MKIFIPIATSLAACIPVPAKTSAAVLGPEQSTLVVTQPPTAAADELAKLFSHRGFIVVDHQTRPNGAMAVRMTGVRHTFFTENTQHEIGSVFYLFVEPHGPHAAVGVIGRQTYDGTEICTQDKAIDAPCEPVHGLYSYQDELDGRAEAAVVHGVLSELRLRGVVDEAAVPAIRDDLARVDCNVVRKQKLAVALQIPDRRKRAVAYARLDASTPRCE